MCPQSKQGNTSATKLSSRKSAPGQPETNPKFKCSKSLRHYLLFCNIAPKTFIIGLLDSFIRNRSFDQNLFYHLDIPHSKVKGLASFSMRYQSRDIINDTMSLASHFVENMYFVFKMYRPVQFLQIEPRLNVGPLRRLVEIPYQTSTPV